MFGTFRKHLFTQKLGPQPRRHSAALLMLGYVFTLAACAGPAVSPSNGSAAGPSPVAKKHLVAAMNSDPEGFQRNLTNPGGGGGSRAPGLIETENLVHTGLVYIDETNVMRLRLAQAVPSTENGLWKVLPDGRMETFEGELAKRGLTSRMPEGAYLDRAYKWAADE